MHPLLELKDVRKRFGSVEVLSGVTLSVLRGEIHAIVGGNGAGKSTLMNVLCGGTHPDAGEVRFKGRSHHARNHRAARKLGIAMVHQELAICGHLSACENVMLGREPHTHGFINQAAMRRDAEAALKKLGATIDLDAHASSLSLPDQQKIEIARAIAGNEPADLLILDEPTSSLAKDDVALLFETLRELRAHGTTILYISHFLEEIRALCDNVTVLRDGHAVLSGPVATTGNGAIIAAMLGRELENEPQRAQTKDDVQVLLRVKNLSGRKRPTGVHFELRRGDVLGIAGLVGAGRTELLRTIAGLDARASGQVQLKNQPVPAERALTMGLGFVPEDRKREGLLLPMSIADNIGLGQDETWSLPKRRDAAARRWIADLGVRCSGPDQPVRELSGGNQQKVVLARLLQRDVEILLLDEPTRGVDIGSRAQIHEVLSDLAKKGKALIVTSSFFPELLALCTHIGVMHKGTLGAVRPTAQWTEAELLSESAGAIA
jgi:ribose transport system ATP-binding protein